MALACTPILLVGLTLGVVALGRGDEGTVAPADGPPPAGEPAPPVAESARTLLLAHRDADSRADVMLVAGVGRDGGAGSILLVPVATHVETPSLGLQPLAAVPALADAELLATTVQNLLGIDLTEVVVLDDLGLLSVLEAAGTLTAELRRAVRLDDAPLALGAGAQEVPYTDAATLLTGTERGSELDHLVTVQGVLDGWLAALRDPEVAAATVERVPELSVLVAAARAEPRIDTLPVEAVSTGGDERFQVRRDDLDEILRRGFPDSLLSPDGERARVEILNGTGAVGVTRQAAACVVPDGGEVVLTGNVPGFGVDRTEVVYYGDEDAAPAARLAETLGAGAPRKASRPLGVIDVTIIVGADFRPCPSP
ncbi:MAG: LytR C-terminal domain-containing protein [Acidimicrobiia bacterium]|nr:LytR C-terminal domain-containing protein [Acidimicrobiia bacterium]